MKQIMNDKYLKNSLKVMFLLDKYFYRPDENKIDLYCYSIFIGKGVRKKTYYQIFDVQPSIDNKKLTLIINI